MEWWRGIDSPPVLLLLCHCLGYEWLVTTLSIITHCLGYEWLVTTFSIITPINYYFSFDHKQTALCNPSVILSHFLLLLIPDYVLEKQVHRQSMSWHNQVTGFLLSSTCRNLLDQLVNWEFIVRKMKRLMVIILLLDQ
jgi:hypothetical protein